MADIIDKLVERTRITLYRTFSKEKPPALTDMRDHMRNVAFRCDGGRNLLPVIKGGCPTNKASRSGSTALCCAVTLKLVERAFLLSTLASSELEAACELCEYCRWQWLNQDAVPEDDV